MFFCHAVLVKICEREVTKTMCTWYT